MWSMWKTLVVVSAIQLIMYFIPVMILHFWYGFKFWTSTDWIWWLATMLVSITVPMIIQIRSINNELR